MNIFLLQLDDDLLFVENPEDREDHRGEDQGPEKGQVLVGSEVARRSESEEAVALGDDSGEDPGLRHWPQGP